MSCRNGGSIRWEARQAVRGCEAIVGVRGLGSRFAARARACLRMADRHR